MNIGLGMTKMWSRWQGSVDTRASAAEDPSTGRHAAGAQKAVLSRDHPLALQAETLTLRIAACDDLPRELPALLAELLPLATLEHPYLAARQRPPMDRTATETPAQGSVIYCSPGANGAHSTHGAVGHETPVQTSREPGLRLIAPAPTTRVQSQEPDTLSTAGAPTLTRSLARQLSKALMSSSAPSPHWHPLLSLADGTSVWLHLSADAPRQADMREILTHGLIAHHQRHTHTAEVIKTAVRDAILKERRTLAAELHDTLAQELSYLQMQTARFARATRDADEALQTLASDVHTQTRRAYRQTRELINGAHASWGDASLASVLATLIEEFETRSAMVFELDNRIPSLHLPETESLHVLFIVREALTNAVRHAHASHARLQCHYPDSAHVLVVIEDNGHGFDPAEVAPAHFGLGIMQERARSIGAQLAVMPRDGGGTRVTLHWERMAP